MPDNPGKTLLKKARKKMMDKMIELDMPAKREKFKGLFDPNNHAGKKENINIRNILRSLNDYNEESTQFDLPMLMSQEKAYYDALSNDNLKKKHIDNWDPSIYTELYNELNEKKGEKKEGEEEEEEEEGEEEKEEEEKEEEEKEEGEKKKKDDDRKKEINNDYNLMNKLKIITPYIDDLHNKSMEIEDKLISNGVYSDNIKLSGSDTSSKKSAPIAQSIISGITNIGNIGSKIFARPTTLDESGNPITILNDAAEREQKQLKNKIEKEEIVAKEREEKRKQDEIRLKAEIERINAESKSKSPRSDQENKEMKLTLEKAKADLTKIQEESKNYQNRKDIGKKESIRINDDPETNSDWLARKLSDFEENNPTESLISTATNTISKGSNDKSSSSNTKAIGKQTPFERYSYLTSGDENNNLRLSALAQSAEASAIRIMGFIKKELEKPNNKDRSLTNSVIKLFKNKRMNIQINNETIEELLPNLQALAYLFQMGRSDGPTTIIKDVVEKANKDSSISADVIRQTERALDTIKQVQDINRQQPRRI